MKQEFKTANPLPTVLSLNSFDVPITSSRQGKCYYEGQNTDRSERLFSRQYATCRCNLK